MFNNRMTDQDPIKMTKENIDYMLSSKAKVLRDWLKENWKWKFGDDVWCKNECWVIHELLLYPDFTQSTVELIQERVHYGQRFNVDDCLPLPTLDQWLDVLEEKGYCNLDWGGGKEYGGYILNINNALYDGSEVMISKDCEEYEEIETEAPTRELAAAMAVVELLEGEKK